MRIRIYLILGFLLILCAPEFLFAAAPAITCTLETNDYGGDVEEIMTYEPAAKIKMAVGAGTTGSLTEFKIENTGTVPTSKISKVAVWIRTANPVSWTGGTAETLFGTASAWVGSTITVSGTFTVDDANGGTQWIYVTYNLASGLTPGTSVALRLNAAAITYSGTNSTVYPLTSSTRPVVSASVMSLPYNVDFESDPGWVVFSTGPTKWERGAPTNGPSSAYAGSNVCGTDLDANYLIYSKTHLTTKIIDLTANSSAIFYHYNKDEATYDGGCVLISTDTAYGWAVITPVGGYPDPDIAALDIPDVGNDRPGYSSTSEVPWRAAEFDLSAYTGKKVRLRFYFASDSSNVNPGWYIDDFSVLKTGPDLTLYSGDIQFSTAPTGITEFNEVVDISATIRNVGMSFTEELTIKQEVEYTSGYYVDGARPQGQGFVISKDLSITAVEIKAWDADTAVADEITTIKITTGTTSIPYIGNNGAQTLASKTLTITGGSSAWWKVTFDEPVLLPVLPSGDAYWIVAYNPASATDGNAWLYEDSDAYTPANRAASANGGDTWTTTSTEDLVFRVYTTSNVAVSFYEGDPDAGGTFIGISTIAAINANQTRVSTMTWTAPSVEVSTNIYVHIDRANLIPESDDTNNKNFNTIIVSSAPDAVKTFSASGFSVSAIDLNWYATGDDGYLGNLNNSTFTIQYTSVTAWAQGTSWSTNTANVPAYVYTVELATTGVAAGSQRFWRQDSLLSNTSYFFRLWTKDDLAPRYSGLSSGATGSTLAEPVTNPQVYEVFYTSVTLNWLPHPASPQSSTCEGYTLQASTASNFTGVIYSSTTYNVNLSTLTMTNLGTNTTYYFRVASLNWYEQTNYIIDGSTCTLKPAPGSSPYNPEISAVFMSSMTMTWTSVSSDDGYLVEASTALDFTGTLSSSKTVNGLLETLTVNEPSLYTNTTYYLRVGSLWGETTSYAATQSASTLADTIKWGKLNEVYITSATFTWQALPTSPPDASSKTCEGYRLQTSTSSDFYGTVFSSSTSSIDVTTLTVSGLSPNVTYYFHVGSLNWDSIGNYLFLISTPTLASSPLNTSAISASSYSITAQWTSGSPANPDDTNYVLETSSNNFDGLTPVFSSATKNLQAKVSGLMSNTTYYLRPKAVNWAGRETYGVTTATSTLAELVSGAQFFQTNVTSITVNWLEMLLVPSSSTCRGYILEASTASDFSGEIFSSSTINGVVPSTLTVKNLYSDTWYYFRVGAYNWNFVPNYVNLGSVKTNIAVPPPDLMITGSDIKFSPTEADFGWVVLISATVRNLSYNFQETAIKQEVEFTSGKYVDTARPQGQGFVISQDSPGCLKSVEVKAWDAGTAGDITTIKITTGTTSVPYIGNNGAQVLASKDITIAGGSSVWWTITFDELVCLPPLSAGDAYWLLAYNPASAANGDAWLYEDSNVYTPAASASSADSGATWTTSTDDYVFRVNYSSCVEVSYYDGDPDAGGTFIGISTIPYINTNQTRVSTISWTAPAPEEYKNIYVDVDRVARIIESDETNNKAFNTIAISSAPDKVTGLTASTNSTTAIDLKWYATGDDGYTGNLNNSTFTIQYTADATWAQSNSWNPDPAVAPPSYVYRVYIATTGVIAGSQQFYTQSGLSINTTYYFRLWILDDFGRYSSLSNGATVCTLAAQPGLPSEPFVVYFSSVSVLWLANGNPDYTEYRLQASTASNFTGDLYGPYVGPTGWLTGASTAAVSLSGCTTYYFQVQARNGGLVETAFQFLGSTRTVTFFDAGLRMYDGTQNVTIACQPIYCQGMTIPAPRIRKDGVNWAIGTVDSAADPNASKLKVQTPSGPKYLRK
ncbi:MAG: fibronectin type III domain-containing protein, partial [Elusimicrobia bacterium]|nr:fibronectin type III domain-containing protein [Elusimicrobiota bacterium]